MHPSLIWKLFPIDKPLEKVFSKTGSLKKLTTLKGRRPAQQQMANEQIELKGVFGGSLFHNVKSGWALFACFFSVFFFLLYRSFAYIIWLQVWGFYQILEYVNVCVSASVGISGAFPLLLFLVQFFCRYKLFCFNLPFNIAQMLACFLKRDRAQIRIGGDVGKTERNRGRGKHNI